MRQSGYEVNLYRQVTFSVFSSTVTDMDFAFSTKRRPKSDEVTTVEPVLAARCCKKPLQHSPNSLYIFTNRIQNVPSFFPTATSYSELGNAFTRNTRVDSDERSFANICTLVRASMCSQSTINESLLLLSSAFFLLFFRQSRLYIWCFWGPSKFSKAIPPKFLNLINVLWHFSSIESYWLEHLCPEHFTKYIF